MTPCSNLEKGKKGSLGEGRNTSCPILKRKKGKGVRLLPHVEGEKLQRILFTVGGGGGKGRFDYLRKGGKIAYRGEKGVGLSSALCLGKGV